jgi:S-adenosylmethionine-dependent methyltransferase
MHDQVPTSNRTLVEKWYDANARCEEHRLDEGRLEFEVTKRVISSCIAGLGQKVVKILDVGGGPGRYGTNRASISCIYL